MLNTEGYRIYAIGDIHGCLDALEMVQADIQADLARNPHDNPVMIYLGDYTDRGPDSRGVIENLLAEQAAPYQTRFLRGNHDDRFLGYLDVPDDMTTASYHWFHPRIGGDETVRSYGVEGADNDAPKAVHAAFSAAVPARHKAFLNDLELTLRIGSYLFVHAGIRPDVPLDEQTKQDLIWIRDPFLQARVDHGFTVVHGHSPSTTVENHGNRIGVDTGAVFNGVLSCLVLEDDLQQVLTPTGRAACPVIR